VAIVQDLGIVLRRLDYSESSQVLAVFTREHGQQRLIAKGIKRATKSKGAVWIDLLELGRLAFTKRPGKEDNLATLTEWVQEDAFRHLRASLLALYAAQYAAEVTSQLVETHDPHAELFDDLRTLLSNLDDTNAVTNLARFLWALFTHIGLRPQLDHCLNCGRDVSGESVVYFSSHQGGAICRDCEAAIVEKRRISRAAIRHFAESSDAPVANRWEAFELMDYHVTHIMSRPPRLSKMFRDLARPKR
jgi:DNA repair protein RecO (recombination protein O)